MTVPVYHKNEAGQVPKVQGHDAPHDAPHDGPHDAAFEERSFVWNKLQTLRTTYLTNMIELYSTLTTRSNQPMPAEQLQKLKHYKDVLHRMIPYLRVPQDRLPAEFNRDKVDAFERQVQNIMDTFQRRIVADPPG